MDCISADEGGLVSVITQTNTPAVHNECICETSYHTFSHPVLQTAMPELMRGFGLSWPGQAVMKWQQFERWGQHNLEYGAPARKLTTIAKPLAGAALLFLALGAASKLARRLTSDP